MRTTACVKSLAAAAILGVLTAPAYATVLVPYDSGNVAGTTNFISLNDVLTADFYLNVGDWSAAGPDLVYLIKATEDLGTITTQSLNPQVKTITNLTLQWNSDAGGGAGTVLSGPLTITDALGNLINTGAISLRFLAGDSAFLIASADAVLKKQTNIDLRVEAIPIPPALALFGSGVVGLGLLARRRKRKAIGPSEFAPLG